MRRTLFEQEHEDFRSTFRTFLEREVVPEYPKWYADGLVPREVFRKLGDLGVLGINLPEEYGGSGRDDYRFNVVLQEEAARAAIWLGTLRTQLDTIQPYFLRFADDEQKARWLPGIASGEKLLAVALTEPDTGSDLAGVRTRAERDGGHYVLNGAKTFITGGILADLVVVLARTSAESNRRNGLTLLVIEDGMPGFEKGRKLDKIGLKAQDTAELSFSNVRVPVAYRLGEEGGAFAMLTANLAQERLAIAVGAVAQSQAALDLTIQYVRERHAFGKPVSSFQNTRFELAAVATEVNAAQVLLDRAVGDLVGGRLTPVDAAMVKLFCTEMQGRALDRCLQLFGGYGYITEFPIAQLYADARVTRIYGGTSEVMKTIISRSLGL